MLIPKKNRREVYKYLFKGECLGLQTAAAAASSGAACLSHRLPSSDACADNAKAVKKTKPATDARMLALPVIN
jgi:hypothetical protein